MEDDSAHAVAEEPPLALPDHPSIPRGAAAWVDTADALHELLTHLRQSGAFAYDSEFIGETSYIPRLCVIQIATRHRVALVDPLARLDLSAFWELLTDPGIQKIVHAGEQDLEPVFRITARPPANVIDTQIAAGFCGLAYPTSLSKLVREVVGARLGKGFTFTHWDRRPLSPVQQRYAADDVRFLPALRDELGKRLDRLGHLAWALEESASLCDPSRYAIDLDSDPLRLRGSSGLPPRNLAILRELYAWREQAARQADLPPRSFLKDHLLIDLARQPIHSVKDLARVKGLPRPVEAEHGQRILDATQRAALLPAEQLPRSHSHEESPSQRFGTESLWVAAQAICLGQSVDPALATSRADIAQFHRAFMREQNTDGHRLMRGWRGQALGEALAAMLREGRNMRLGWRDGALATGP
jgi:ribonuclease D